MSFPEYPRYKATNDRWLDAVPDHWQFDCVKRFAEVRPSNVDKKSHDDEIPVRLCNYTDVYRNETISSDLDFMSATATKEQVERFRLIKGDVLITKDSETADDIAIAALVSETLEAVVCGYHLALLRPINGNSGAFLKRFFDSRFAKSQVAVRANGLTRVGLSQYSLDNLRIPFPPPEEQRAIAAFLDRETAKIDALVAEQERLIALLKEKRQAVISHAVTKGLNPAAPMKDSGVEWLGQIPAHWEVKRLKHVANVQTGVAKGKDNGYVATITVPYLRVANVQDGYIDLTDVAEMQIPTHDLPRYRLRAGDVLMNEGGDFDKLGRGAVWDGGIDPCIHQNHVFAVRPIQVTPDWLNLVTSSASAQNYFVSRSKQSTNLASISSTNLMDLPLAVPPPDEAAQIILSVAERLDQIDKLIGSAEQSSHLLQERRAALISAAVTGKIDVRGLAPIIETKPAAWVRDQVGAEIISLQAHKPKFGRVKFQKQIFLAETHAGVSEIGGRYQREAAGPFDRALIGSVEKSLEDAGLMTVKQAAKGAAVTYHLKSGANPDRDGLKAALGDRAEALGAMIKLTADLDTPAIEAVATLYAVWNDLLIDGQPAPDDRIITGVLSEWHPEKAEKFTRAGLQSWLEWMRRHDLVPSGEGPKTQLGSLL
jgi:type I restriction enzyme S subunit